MAKITRVTAQLFANTAGGTDVEQFGSFQAGAAVYTSDPVTIMATSAWLLGWSATQFNGVFEPYFQDRNAVDLVMFYQLAYLLQQGIAEWDSGTTYYLNSVVQSGGSIFLSLQNANLNNTPPAGASNAFWQYCAFPSANQAKSPTRTVYTAASGTYTPPVGCVRIFARLVGGGGGGGSGGNAGGTGGNGVNTTLGAITSGGGSGGQPHGAGLSAGGAGGIGSGGYLNIPGGTGFNGSNGSQPNPENGYGAYSKFGGAGATVRFVFMLNTPGKDAVTNSGAGGSGGIASSGSPLFCGGGGGSGAYVEAMIYNPAAMSYSVGAGGAGGSSSGGANGGNGAAGIIIIDEFYY